MVKSAWNLILPAWLLAVVGAALAWQGRLWGCGLASLALAASAFIGWFFRDPERRIPLAAEDLVSPADGRVIAIEPISDPWLGQGVEIRIFLSLLDVHVQRSPFTVRSLVEGTRYFGGKFMAASAPKASLQNEQHWVRISSGKRKAMVKQIAGLVARRIIPWTRPGESLEGGQRIGIIQFGSQVDLALSKGAALLCKVGDRVLAGETVLARYPKGRARG